jgi:pimeloyl-ACP methyl ester carboxylesterase
VPPVSRRVALPTTGLGYHLLEWGADDAALDHTVVLVHGLLDIAHAWEPVVEAGLAGRYHVIAPDMRGHGDSDRVGAGGYYHFMDYLADLHDLLAQTARKRVSLVGHSMGGSIASYYAGTYPDRVHGLALLEGTGPPDFHASFPERVAEWIEGWTAVRGKGPRTYASVEEAADRLRAYDPLLDREQAMRLAEQGTRLADWGGVQFKHDPLHMTRAPYPFRLDVAEQFWARVSCPVLLVEGADSVFRQAPEESARRAAVFANARSALLEGAGHMMHRHKPAELARLLVEFLG